MSIELNGSSDGSACERIVRFYKLPQIQNFSSQKALKGAQKAMARQPMVTRTIPTTIADILVINVDTGISEEREVSIPREYKKVKKLREAIEALVNTDTEKLAHIKSTTVVETLYGMSEQDFINRAKILPPRGTKEANENETVDD